jgi:hypothetical protein
MKPTKFKYMSALITILVCANNVCADNSPTVIPYSLTKSEIQAGMKGLCSLATVEHNKVKYKHTKDQSYQRTIESLNKGAFGINDMWSAAPLILNGEASNDLSEISIGLLALDELAKYQVSRNFYSAYNQDVKQILSTFERDLTQPDLNSSKRLQGCRMNPHAQTGKAKTLTGVMCNGRSQRCAEASSALIDFMGPCYATEDGHESTLKYFGIEKYSSLFSRTPPIISMTQQLEAALQDVDTIKVSIKLAQLLEGYITESKQGRLNLQTNIWLDTVRLFEEMNYQREIAKEKALELLGLYGTRGANVSPWLMLNSKRALLFAHSMGKVALSIRYLDVAMSAQNKSYSLPSQVNNNCDYSRPYHFWMSAYLASTLANRNYSPREAVEATHIIGAAYEMAADVATNDQTVIHSAQARSPYQVETQKDIVFNDVGAAWGASLSTGRMDRQFNMSAFLAASFYEAKEPNGVLSYLSSGIGSLLGGTGYNVDSFLKWKSRLAPDAHFPSLLEEIR